MSAEPSASPPYPAAPRPRIVIDGLFFQLMQTGIARLWRSYLEQWAGTDFARQIVILDREGSAPRLPGFAYHPVPKFDYDHAGRESIILEKWCRELEADLFVSTFYSAPIKTRSLMIVHDMIYELEQGDQALALGGEEKRLAMLQARHFVAVSRSTARDIRRIYPFVPEEDITVVLNGVAPAFAPAPAVAVAAVREKFGLKKPYYLLVGIRKGFNGYKNAVFPVRTLNEMPEAAEVEIVCVGGEPSLEELAAFGRVSLRLFSHVSEEDLIALYSGAEALLYPSRYEGFGLPLIEAMACGCPVITCPNGSIPEVAGDAAIFVGNDNESEMAAALRKLREPDFRRQLQSRGMERARLFSWKKAADELADAFSKALALPEMPPRDAVLWQHLRETAAHAETERQNLARQAMPRRRVTFRLGPCLLFAGVSRAKR